MRRSLVLLILGLLALAPAELAAEDEARVIRVVGSGYTMPRFTRVWAEAFEARRGIRVEIVGTGTSTGPMALLRGEAQLASMTRPMQDPELEALREELGSEPISVPVAADALVVFVNESNPLDQLSLRQVDAVFSRTRRCGASEPVTRWGQLGLTGSWESRAISLYGRRPGSGTGTFFADVALCGGRFQQWMRINPGGETAARAVAESRYGIGFGSRVDGREGMKVLALSEQRGPARHPEPAAVYDGSYPLGRMLRFYAVAPVPQAVRDFVAYGLSDEGQRAVEAAGYLRVPPEVAAEALKALE